MIYTQRQVDRFWNNVAVGEPDECWPWKRSSVNGYGQVSLKVNDSARILKAHKVAWELHNDQRLSIFDRATHSCGNKLCCNPHHVIVDSTPDVPAGVRGEKHGNAKLTARQVKLIKYRLNALTTREIADTMRVSYGTIWDIRRLITWRHI